MRRANRIAIGLGKSFDPAALSAIAKLIAESGLAPQNNATNLIGYCCHTIGGFIDQQTDSHLKAELREALLWLIDSVGESRKGG